MRRLGRRLLIGCLLSALAGLTAYSLRPRSATVRPPAGPAVVWVFDAPRAGGFMSPPWVAGDTIYASALLARGFRYSGAVYALDPATGKPRWAFDDGGAMKGSASAPVLADGRIYVGEGMHADFACRLRCLDAATGRKVWDHEAADHIESTPAVADGVVYFAAGNDGVYALDADAGVARWHYAADLHLDASPCVSGGKVFVGSGPSRRFQALQVVALDARTGGPVWRVPVELPAWGSPRAAGGRVYVGLGTGRLLQGAQPPEVPAGAVVCLDERDGSLLWTFRTADAVFQQPTVERGRVYFGSRDGNLYVADAFTGRELYRVAVGGPVIAPPTVADGRIYVVTLNGLLRCLEAADGRGVWQFDFLKKTDAEPLIPAAVRVAGGRVYVAAELQTRAGSVASLYCFQP